MKHIITLACVSTLIALVGCNPKPKRLDNNSALTINNRLLEMQYNFVPKDPFLGNSDWTYHIVVTKINGEYLRNDEVLKTFLLAHNADKIILVGAKDLIQEYKHYFKQHQVTAIIEMQPVSPVPEDLDKVNILFFHKNLDSFMQ
ncbi:cag pathogenicity island Cag12 family protein [Helicobacter trogontum]|uniref:Cag pathogenicity island protein n=1 Tax=Helicobacter trogontum TaxID=50960 RepID=A0A4U8S3X3_9HELI|nr:cag pathogenicity island Cag12 family protein [Helicobacter trogontum]MCI5786043.1 cag pathogenicity island Cag12 family protein [Helicobacter trogontum]TLD80367.1 cag pathogenicity island protein [Helicobacter trogontum]